METRYNDATINRPDGNRMIEGPVVFSDLPEISRQLWSEKAYATNELNGITVFKTDNLTTVLTILKKGTHINKNELEGPYSLLVLNGKLSIKTEGEKYKLRTGQMLNLQARVEFSIVAEKETVLLHSTAQ
jgi:quercetin dioxygenase-like cupin family protein